jgi:formylglycine-generating enzyme required for sulfatase activity
VTDRVLRGGGWYSVASYARVASRGHDVPSCRLDALGFRLVEEPKEVHRVTRGGGWNYTSPADARVALRFRYAPSGRFNNLGFRFVEEVEEPKVEEPKEVERMNRGGGWYFTSSGAREANRFGDTPASRDYDLGFRLVEERGDCDE